MCEPAATCAAPAPFENSGTFPSPNAFQTTSATTLGRTPAPNAAIPRHRRATRSARPAPTKKGAFDGLIPSAIPASRPAMTPSAGIPSCAARSTKYAATASTTIAGKSDITDRPNDCGSKSSVYRWW